MRTRSRVFNLFSGEFVDVPWGMPCARLEGGARSNRNGDSNATCEVGIPRGVLYIVNRGYVVDEELGVAALATGRPRGGSSG